MVAGLYYWLSQTALNGGGIVTGSIPCNFYISRKKMKTIESQIQIFWGIH